MWLCALLALVTLHEAEPLREIRPFNVDPSAISNIELLIPLSIPAERPERSDLSSESYEDERASDQRPAHHEPFSSIPAYAFTLDATGNSPRASAPTSPSPMLTQSRSLYLAQLWPHSDEQSTDESDTGTDTAQKVGQEVCHRLARQQKGSARELLLYLCTELLDVLVPHCTCCEDERAVRPRAAPIHKQSIPMPWFGPVGGRREWMPVEDNRVGPSQRVFV